MGNTINDALDFISNKDEVVADEIKKDEVKEDVVIKPEKVLEHIEKKEIKETVEESKQDSKEETANEPPKFTDEQFWAKAKEILGKDVSSKDDLIIKEEVVKEVVTEKEYISDFSKGYDTYFKETGGTPKDYLMLQRDISSLSKEEVIKESLKAENGNLTNVQLSRLYNRKFGINQDDMTEEEVSDRELDIDIAYNKGKNFLEKQKESYTVPKDNSIASIEAKASEQQAQIEQANQLWSDTVAQENTNLTGIEINLGEDFKFTHPISDDKRKSVKEVAEDASLQKFYQRYKNEDGSYDALRYQNDIFLLDNRQDVFQDIREHAQATQIEKDIKGDKNIDFKSDAKPSIEKKYSKQVGEDLDILRHKYKLKT